MPADQVLDRHGFDLDRIEAQLPEDSGHDEHHHHDHIDGQGIASVSLTCDAPLDTERLEQWLPDLLARHGSDILRTKGVLSVAGEDRKLVLQAVNMMLEGDHIGLWKKGDARRSRMVFIGRKLDRDELNAGFQRCRQGVAEYAE